MLTTDESIVEPEIVIRDGLVGSGIQKIIGCRSPITESFDKATERFVKVVVSEIVVFVRRLDRCVGSEYSERFGVSWVAG